MSFTYNPDLAAIPVAPLTIALLSQRDLEVEIPIDKPVHPGISITAACFGNLVYADNAATRCISNLLAVGYRRLSLDIFWDSSRRIWSLCPAQLPSSAALRRDLQYRQIVSGQYTCSLNMTLDAFSRIITDHLRATSTNLEARITFISLRVHAAYLASGVGLRLNGTQLPGRDEEISDVLGRLSDDIYTPVRLLSERENLNSSWLATPESPKPDLAYIITSFNSNNDLTTANGWPNAGTIGFQKRLLIAVGPVDDAMAGYNRTNDYNSYYNASSITNLPDIAYNSSGSLSQGCLYDPSNTNIGLTSQWSISTNFSLVESSQQNTGLIPIVSNLTSCGISPFVNNTIGQSADLSINPHISFITSTIWSWAPGEPRNITSMDSNPDRLRCAVQDSSLNGHWRLADCTNDHYGACRSQSNPLQWSFSKSRGTYQSREDACPSGTTFAVPRTALENRYMAAAFSSFRSSLPSNTEGASDVGPWVDLNSLNAKNCWVQGKSSTCPYLGGTSTSRQIVIPVVAAVVVLVIAALLLFVKCASNRSNTRRGRKRRGRDDHGEYEGVPS